jgi:hypothetical protein
MYRLNNEIPPDMEDAASAQYDHELRTKEYLLSQPQDTDVVHGQLDRYIRAVTPHGEWARVAKKCTDYCEGRQWSLEDQQKLNAEGRPFVTLNKISPLVRLIQGYFRQNRYDTVFMPANNGQGIQETAEVLTAIAKQISANNQTKWQDAQVFADGIITSRGFWDVRLDFQTNILGEIRERNCDPFSILIDPEAEDYNPSEWGYVFEQRWMSLSDIFMLYGGTAAADVVSQYGGDGQAVVVGDQGMFHGYNAYNETPLKHFGHFDSVEQELSSNSHMGYYGTSAYHSNRSRRVLRVLDCQHHALKEVKFFINTDTGAEQIIPDNFTPMQTQRVLGFAQEMGITLAVRSAVRKQVRWTTTVGNRVVYDKWSPYQAFTKVPYFAYFRRGFTMGMINDLLDPQDIVNKTHAAMTHIIMTTANSGWLAEEGSLTEDMQAAIEEEGSRPGIVINYKKGTQAPQRIQPSVPPSSVKMLNDIGTMGLKEISGINDSALGQLDIAQSGIAVQARQKQSIVGAEIYFDNFERSRELRGRHELQIIQSYYTEERIVKTVSSDGTEENYVANQKAAERIINNLSVGSYDVVIDSAPISATFTQGQFDQVMEMRKEGIPVPDDVVVDLSSIPQKTKIKKRLEEQKTIDDEMKQLQLAQVKMQMGLDPTQPAPPVFDDGIPPVTPYPQQQPEGI